MWQSGWESRDVMDPAHFHWNGVTPVIIQTTPPPPKIFPFPLLTLYVTNLQLIQNLKFCQTRASSVQGDFFSTIVWLTANSLKDACWMIAAFSADLVQVHMTNCTLISSLSGGRKHSSEYIPYNAECSRLYISIQISMWVTNTVSFGHHYFW